MELLLDFAIDAQPDETSCGPTCLHSVYRYLGHEFPLEQVQEEMRMLPSGGTLSVFLANHALRRGFRATIYTYDLKIFDPTWMELEPAEVMERLEHQAAFKKDDVKLQLATRGFVNFLSMGGRIRMEDLRPGLVRRILKQEIPILTGLSATYLYQTPREYGPADDWDDIRGEPAGHFVVLCGFDRNTGMVRVADPFQNNPAFPGHIYTTKIERVITAILLGIVTYDANLLLIEPPDSPQGSL